MWLLSLGEFIDQGPHRFGDHGVLLSRSTADADGTDDLPLDDDGHSPFECRDPAAAGEGRVSKALRGNRPERTASVPARLPVSGFQIGTPGENEFEFEPGTFDAAASMQRQFRRTAGPVFPDGFADGRSPVKLTVIRCPSNLPARDSQSLRDLEPADATCQNLCGWREQM